VTASPPSPDDAHPPLVAWLWSGLYLLVGILFVGLGIGGAYLPLVPTTPFLLLASYFLTCSWPALDRRVQQIPIFGRYLRDWNEHRGVRREVKWLAATVCLVTATAGGWLASASWLSQSLLWGLILVGLLVVWRLPTIR
jgi:uncharacterized membrane protein YbaN (DUF454 family)